MFVLDVNVDFTSELDRGLPERFHLTSDRMQRSQQLHRFQGVVPPEQPSAPCPRTAWKGVEQVAEIPRRMRTTIAAARASQRQNWMACPKSVNCEVITWRAQECLLNGLTTMTRLPTDRMSAMLGDYRQAWIHGDSNAWPS